MHFDLTNRADSYLVARELRKCGSHLFDFADALRLHIEPRTPYGPSRQLLELRSYRHGPVAVYDDHPLPNAPRTHWPILAVSTVRQHTGPYAPRVAALTFAWNDLCAVRDMLKEHAYDSDMFVGALLHLCTGRCENDSPPLRHDWRSRRDQPEGPSPLLGVLLLARKDSDNHHKASTVTCASHDQCGNWSFGALWRAATSGP